MRTWHDGALIITGGLMRCCIKSYWLYISKQDTMPEVGTLIPCEHYNESMIIGHLRGRCIAYWNV